MITKIHLIFAASIAVTILLTMIIIPYASSPFPGLLSTPEGTFYWPRDVAVNSTDFIFVADTQNSRGQIFDSSGNFLATFGFPGNNVSDGSLNQPFGLFINSTDYIHVADTFTNVVKVYDPNGAYVKTIGTPGTGTDEYYYPSGVTLNSTHILIADSYNNRIVITDLSGNSQDEIP